MESTFNFIFLYNSKGNTFDFSILKKRLSKNLPDVTCFLVGNGEIEKMIDELPTKDIKMLTLMPFLANHIPFILKKLPSIKWIHSLTAGIELFFNIDEIKNPPKDFVFSNSKGAYSDSLAEFGVLSILYFNYNVPKYIQSFTNREWKGYTNQLVDKKTICIYGYGQNGIALAKRIKPGFGMKIIGVVREKRDNLEGKEYCDEFYTFEEMNKEIIERSDFIFATLPETPKTINIFDKSFFKSMNKNAIFINIGRGTAVVENDLAEALNNNIIRGAVLDVTYKEPLDKKSKLYDISPEKLIITNHSVGFTPAIQDLCFERLEENIGNYLKTGKPIHIVNISEQY